MLRNWTLFYKPWGETNLTGKLNDNTYALRKLFQKKEKRWTNASASSEEYGYINKFKCMYVYSFLAFYLVFTDPVVLTLIILLGLLLLSHNFDTVTLSRLYYLCFLFTLFWKSVWHLVISFGNHCKALLKHSRWVKHFMTLSKAPYRISYPVSVESVFWATEQSYLRSDLTLPTPPPPPNIFATLVLFPLHPPSNFFNQEFFEPIALQ